MHKPMGVAGLVGKGPAQGKAQRREPAWRGGKMPSSPWLGQEAVSGAIWNGSLGRPRPS